MRVTERDRITIDRWQHAEDFTRFQEQFGEEYKALDTKLEGQTVSERKLETFLVENGMEPDRSSNLLKV